MAIYIAYLIVVNTKDKNPFLQGDYLIGKIDHKQTRGKQIVFF
jgi:hypothetical protein